MEKAMYRLDDRRLTGRVKFVGILLICLLVTSVWAAGGRDHQTRNTLSDDYWHYHNVGDIGLTITNFGVLGQGYNNEDQPSCWYRLKSSMLQEQIEHFSYSGIWVGGVKNNRAYVSTAIYDGVFDYEDGGWEFTSSATDRIKFSPIFEHVNKIDRRYDFSRLSADSVITIGGAINAQVSNGYIEFPSTTWDTLVTRSSIYDASGDAESNPYANYARFFDPNAISHQDLICAYTDTNTVVPGTGISIPDHEPLGVHIYQEAYAWYHSFANSFSILDYTITNIPTGWEIAESDTTVQYSDSVSVEYATGDTIWYGDVIEAPYFGIWVDASVGNMNYTSVYDNSGGPGGRFNWYDNLNDYEPDRRLAMQWDVDGDAGWAQSYLGVQVLGAEPRGTDWSTFFNQWTWRGSSYSSNWPIPADEEERYEYMGEFKGGTGYASLPLDDSYEQSWMMLLTCGPMPDMAPGTRFKVALGIIGGLWNGSGVDNDERRTNIYRNADWAQVAYNGEDRNGNGELDPGEDTDGDGKITRYILPEAPPSPQMTLVPENQKVTVYWNNTPESTIDPISNKMDFEGYRIYGSPKTEGSSSEWSLLAEFDVDYTIDPGDSTLVGYNTGFDLITIEDGPVEINGVDYQYKWENTGVLNGWPRDLYYSVVSFDRGDEENNLPSLQSPVLANRTYAYPGTPAAEAGDERVSVYPNPYRGSAKWDGTSARDRLIWFRYLPARCEVKIFTLAGELVDSFTHNSATYDGSDVERVTRGSDSSERRAFAGGEHAWDLLSKDDQEIATGLYVFTVEDLSNGDVKVGKFLVIK